LHGLSNALFGDLLEFDQIAVGILNKEGVDRKLRMKGRFFINIAGILEFFVLAQDLFVIIEIQRKTDAFWTGQRFSSILVFAKAEVAIAGIKNVKGIALFLMDRQLQDLVIEMIRLLNVADRQKDDGGLNRHMSLLSFL